MLELSFAIVFIIFVYATLLFVLSILNKRNDLADIGWGVGFIIISSIAVAYDYMMGGAVDFRTWLVALLVFAWGIRLSFHIWKRNVNKSEDWRYQEWREKWGKWFYIRSYLQVYLLQAGFMLLISTPVVYSIVVLKSPYPTIFDFLAVSVWTIGYLYEMVADRQLKLFLSREENKGKVMDKGLWSLSRHPNYFGEITMWWGIYIFTLNDLSLWWTFIGPLTINLLIVYVSGVPLLEKRYEGNTEYEEYKKNVSKLIPLHYGKTLFYKGKDKWRI